MYEYDFCEYAVEKKKCGAFLFRIIAAAAVALLLIILAFAIAVPRLGMSAGLIILVLVGVLLWYLSRYTSIEYEYTQTGYEIDFASVYSKQYRKEQLSVDIKKSARLIAPYDAALGGMKVEKIYDFRSSPDAGNSYMIIFEEDKAKYAVLFDATKRLVANLRHQAPSIVTTSDTLPEE